MNSPSESDCAFPVNPDSFTVTFTTQDAVVTAVPEAFGFRTECRNETAGDEFAVCLGPADGKVVAAEIFFRSERARFDAFSEVLIHMSPQDGFAQSSRTTVNEHHELLLALLASSLCANSAAFSRVFFMFSTR